MRLLMKIAGLFCLLNLFFWALGSAAVAHSSGRGFVALLPTGYYLFAGATAVLASFVVLTFVRPREVAKAVRRRWHLPGIPRSVGTICSLLGFLMLSFLLAVGWWGSHDPLVNLLPLTVWTLWWVGMTLAHGVFGNLWALCNPWSGPYRVIMAVLRRTAKPRPWLNLPEWIGYWPAIAGFCGFVWFELIYPAPADPEDLALTIAIYWLFNMAGVLLFGDAPWLARVECFSVFFRFIAALSPLAPAGRTEKINGHALALPGARLLQMASLPLSGVLFILLTLSSVSFDGFAKSFFWLGLAGINPLEFPGRTAVIGLNSLGLLGSWCLLSGGFLGAIWLGWVWAGRQGRFFDSAGLLVFSIIPLSLGYHFAHYLTQLLVNGQYFLAALSDPLGLGWNILGLEDFHVTTSFLNHLDSVRLIWRVQAGAIISAHVFGVVLAHKLAFNIYADGRRASLSQVPLAMMMVLYTLFGLWLLATPVAA